MSGTLMTREPRALRRWFARDPLTLLREEMGELFSSFLGEAGDAWQLERITPTLDLSETDATVEVRMDLPGVKPDDVDIQISGNMLTISGERKQEKEEKGSTFHRIERRTGNYSRTLTLPYEVKEDKVEARYRDGVLTITLPKSEEAKARKISVKS